MRGHKKTGRARFRQSIKSLGDRGSLPPEAAFVSGRLSELPRSGKRKYRRVHVQRESNPCVARVALQESPPAPKAQVISVILKKVHMHFFETRRVHFFAP